MNTKYKWVACWFDEDKKQWVPGDYIRMKKSECYEFIEDQKLDGCSDFGWMIAMVRLDEGDTIE